MTVNPTTSSPSMSWPSTSSERLELGANGLWVCAANTMYSIVVGCTCCLLTVGTQIVLRLWILSGRQAVACCGTATYCN